MKDRKTRAVQHPRPSRGYRVRTRIRAGARDTARYGDRHL